GASLGFVLGTGLLLVWRSGARGPRSRPGLAARRLARRTELLQQAGIDGVGAMQLVGLQIGCGAVALLAVQLVTGTSAVAACFAGFGVLVPSAVVRRARRRRQAQLRDAWPEAIDHLIS